MSLLSDLTTLFGNAYSTAALAATDWVTALTNSLVSLGGKAGGQTIYGSTQANESLALLPNPSAGGVLTLSDALRIVEIPSVSASSVVATNTANGLVALAYSATPGNNTIPSSTAAGKLAAGWGGDASTLATLDANSKVVQNPANASTTGGANVIPLADANGCIGVGGTAIATKISVHSAGEAGIRFLGNGLTTTAHGLFIGYNSASYIYSHENTPMYLATNGTTRLTIAADGAVTIAGDTLIVGTSKTPASAAAAGVAGQIAWDASYVYVCTATNTWKRAAIATW